MPTAVPFVFSRRSPPPLSALQLNPPQQRWQLATDDDGSDAAAGRAERPAAEPQAVDDDAGELRAELHSALARLTDPAAVDEADSASATADDDASGAAAAATSRKTSVAEPAHDPLTCIVCGPVLRRSEPVERAERSGKEEAMECSADGDAAAASAQSAAAAGGEVPLLQMSDLVFLIWDYLPLSQVLHFQNICPRWKELLRLKPGSEEDEGRALAEEQRQQEEREKVGDVEALRRHQREMQHTATLHEHAARADRTAAAPYPPPILPLPPMRLPTLLADFDTLLGRQLAFYRAVTGRRARDDPLYEDMGLRDELRHMSAQDIAAITGEIEDMDESEDDAAMTEVNRPGRVRQRERRFERQQTKRARFTPAMVRALWERAHDRVTTSGTSTSNVSVASAATANSSLWSRPAARLSSDLTWMDDTQAEAGELMAEEKLPHDNPTLWRPSFSLSASSSASSSPAGSPVKSLSFASTDASFSSSSSSFSSASSSSAGSFSPAAVGSPLTADGSCLSAWSSRSYLRRLTHAKLALSPFNSPSLSPAVLASLSSLTSVNLFHFPFVRSVFDAEYEGAEAEAEEVRQLKDEKEAGEKEERRAEVAQQNKHRQALSKHMQEEVKELVGTNRASHAEDRSDAREAREARDARDLRCSPPARLVAVLTRHARLMATHSKTSGDTPPLHLLKPLASQLTTLIYSPACLATRDMDQLQALTSLTSLSIHCQMSEAGMRSDEHIAPFLSAFPALQSLSLYCEDNGAAFPANFVPYLALLQPTLTSLAIHSAHWKNEHIAAIARLAQLRSLTLSFTTTPITPAHFTTLAALTHLAALTLHCGTHLSYALPAPLFALGGLRELAVFGSVNVHQSAFGLLSELRELVRLRVSGCFDSLNGLVRCVVACPQLRVLDVRGSAMSWHKREMLRCERPDIKVLENNN